MRELLYSFGLSALFAVAPVPAPTQIQPQSSSAAQSPASGVASTSGVRDEILTELKYEEDRFVRLAQAIPAEKYTWRPVCQRSFYARGCRQLQHSSTTWNATSHRFQGAGLR